MSDCAPRHKETSGRQQAGQPHLSPWEDCGSCLCGNHFQAREGQEDDWEQLAWAYWGQTVPGQHDGLVSWSDGGERLQIREKQGGLFSSVVASFLRLSLASLGPNLQTGWTDFPVLRFWGCGPTSKSQQWAGGSVGKAHQGGWLWSAWCTRLWALVMSERRQECWGRPHLTPAI